MDFVDFLGLRAVFFLGFAGDFFLGAVVFFEAAFELGLAFLEAVFRVVFGFFFAVLVRVLFDFVAGASTAALSSVFSSELV